MKSVIRTREGTKQLTWLLEQIANANVPAEIRPLLFDSKRVDVMGRRLATRGCGCRASWRSQR